MNTSDTIEKKYQEFIELINQLDQEQSLLIDEYQRRLEELKINEIRGQL